MAFGGRSLRGRPLHLCADRVPVSAEVVRVRFLWPGGSDGWSDHPARREDEPHPTPTWAGRERKRKYLNRTFHGTRKAAQKFLTKKLRERDTGELFEAPNVTVGDFLDQWLDAIQGSVRRRTHSDYSSVCDGESAPTWRTCSSGD